MSKQSHDDGYSYSFSSDGHQFGGHDPLAPSGSATVSVTRVDQSETTEVRITQFSPYSSPIHLVFAG